MTRQEYLQNWNKTHKEYFKQWRQKNKDKIQGYSKKYSQSVKGKQQRRTWKAKNKNKFIEYNKLGREKAQSHKKLAVEYLGGKCTKCNGIFHPCAFDFHHRNPLEKDYKMATRLYSSWNNVKLELDKCDLLCANCHR